MQSRSKEDVIERFFTWGETACCPTMAVEDLLEEQKDPDVLDYVFDNVESFTCVSPPVTASSSSNHDKDAAAAAVAATLTAAGATAQQVLPILYETLSQVGSLRCDNSLIEAGSLPVAEQEQNTTNNYNHNGSSDMLDSCFDKVESFVCTEGNEALLMGQAAPANPIFQAYPTQDGGGGGGGIGIHGDGQQHKKEQLQKAKDAIEAQLSAMDVDEDEEHNLDHQKEDKKQSKGLTFFDLLKKSRSSSSSSNKKKGDHFPGCNESPIPTNISIATRNTPTSSPIQHYDGRPVATALATDPASIGDYPFYDAVTATTTPVPVTPPPKSSHDQSETPEETDKNSNSIGH